MTANSQRSLRLSLLLALVTDAVHVITTEWDRLEQPESTDPESLGYSQTQELPFKGLFEASRMIISACGSFLELLQSPEERLFTCALGSAGASALQVVAEHRIADHLAQVDCDTGVSIDDLGMQANVDAGYLARIMRLLCSMYIFTEVSDGRFASNRISAALVANETALAYITVLTTSISNSIMKIPEYLTAGSPIALTPFQIAHDTEKDYFQWLANNTEIPRGAVKAKTEIQLFNLGMIAAGRMGQALLHDFPWAVLGKTTLVDVGGGVGECPTHNQSYLTERFVRWHVRWTLSAILNLEPQSEVALRQAAARCRELWEVSTGCSQLRPPASDVLRRRLLDPGHLDKRTTSHFHLAFISKRPYAKCELATCNAISQVRTSQLAAMC